MSNKPLNYRPFLTSFRERINKLNPRVCVVILFILFFIIPWLTYDKTVASGDLAEYLNNPMRLLNGELPYKDFWLLFPPGEVYFPYLIYKLFGVNINIILIASLIISSLIGVMSFIIGRKVMNENIFAFLLAIIVFFNGITALDDGYTYIHMYFLLSLFSVYFYINYIVKSSWKPLLIAGLLVGVSFLFRLYEVGPLLLAMIFVIFIPFGFKWKYFKKSLKVSLIFFSGVFFILSIASFMMKPFFFTMIHQIFFDSISHGTSMNKPYFSTLQISYNQFVNTVQTLFQNLTPFNLKNVIFQVFILINICVSFILPLILFLVSIGYLFKWQNKSQFRIIFFFFLWGALMFPKALGRSDLAHLSPALSILFFNLIFFTQLRFVDGKGGLGYKGLLPRVGYLILIVTLLFTLPLYLYSATSNYLSFQFKIRTSTGTLELNNESEANNINNVIKFIKETTKESDFIFVTYWNAPPIYALTKRRNPTYYDSLIDLVVRPSMEKQMNICNDLFIKNTKLIIHNSDWGFDDNYDLQFKRTCKFLNHYITSHYKLIKKFGNYSIYYIKT